MECKSNTPERQGYHVYVDHTGTATTLVVSFDVDHGPQRHFSFMRIVLYRDASWVDAQHTWTIRQLEHLIHSSKDHAPHTPRSDSTLPAFTVAFKVFLHDDGSVRYALIPTSSVDELRHRDSKSVCILLESKHSLTPDSLSVSVAVTRTIPPTPIGDARPRITSSCLPTEILLKIFERTESCECKWQHDLLLFAQVCRRWSQCALKVLFTRLESSEWKSGRFFHSDQSLDPWGFAEALRKTPALGRDVRQLDVDQHKGMLKCRHHAAPKESPGFVQALIAIVRATKNLQRLHLSLGYPPSWLENARFLALPELSRLHTLSITRAFHGNDSLIHSPYSISTIQLACCMSRWPSLTSLTVEDLKPGKIGVWRFSMRPPACALTQLSLRNCDLSDKDFLYLTASSAKTLTHVTLDHVSGISADGLNSFLDAISQNVTSLTIRYTGYPEHPHQETPLDVTVDKMPCLQTLNIFGDIASEHMLRRRSEMFARSCGLGVSVVRLSFEFVPRVRRVARCKWAGWEIVNIY
ncbi:hypothetical protein EV363DRAFT_1151193 [Boletus edulis]|nr:hypothetical protein EV363DRAFT_1151193 [Boletus edulis]